MDWCYGQDEGVGEVFLKEVKPLLQGILKGGNGCVIAYGAQGSGKTQLIQVAPVTPLFFFYYVIFAIVKPIVSNLGESSQFRDPKKTLAWH